MAKENDAYMDEMIARESRKMARAYAGRPKMGAPRKPPSEKKSAKAPGEEAYQYAQEQWKKRGSR